MCRLNQQLKPTHENISRASHRLDRLPISRYHKITLVGVAFAYFFEFADINTFAVTAPKLVKVWGVTINQIAYVTSLSFVGMFFGSIIGGVIADRWGRKNALTITTLWFALFSFATVFSMDIVQLGIAAGAHLGRAVRDDRGRRHLRQRDVPGRGPRQVPGLRHRHRHLRHPGHQPDRRLVVPLNDWSWRLVYLWGSLGVLFLLFARYLTESPRWYESKGQFDKADAVLTEIEARVSAEKGPLPEPAPPAEFAPESKVKASLKLLLHKKYLVPTLVLCVLWVTQTIGFFGYSSWAPTLLSQEGMSVEKSIFYVALTTVGAPLGCFLAALVTDRFERKWLWSSSAPSSRSAVCSTG